MSDWADEKALEWLDMVLGPPGGFYHESCIASLAVLLREVALSGPTPDVGQMLEAARHREDAAKALLKVQMAEVRRVVEEQRSKYAHLVALNETRTYEQEVCDEILSRLEKLS